MVVGCGSFEFAVRYEALELCEHGCSPRGSLVEPTVELKHTVALQESDPRINATLEKNCNRTAGIERRGLSIYEAAIMVPWRLGSV